MRNSPLGPVILDIAGVELNQEDKELLKHPQVGGLILFTRNYECPKQLSELVGSIRAHRSELVICVDHEGGRVQRFREGFTVLPAMQKLGEAYCEQPERIKGLARDLGWLMASELVAFDIDFSFAPVLDIDDCVSDIIGDRSFSNDPGAAIVLIEGFIDGMLEAGMAATGKHFPGHGGIKGDSHLELPIDRRTLRELEERDILPFKQLADKLGGVMPAHIVFPEVDSLPVGFSTYWLKHYLRSTLKFKGVIFSDDLSMEGAAGVGGFADRAHLAMEAGCDSVLVCNHRKGAALVVECLEARGVDERVAALESMKKKSTCNNQQLRKDSRWLETVEAIQRLF
jgi:beta-N-acetylhexosaminidase